MIIIGSYGAFGNQGGAFGGNRMDTHRGGSNADRDNRVSNSWHVAFLIIYLYQICLRKFDSKLNHKIIVLT